MRDIHFDSLIVLNQDQIVEALSEYCEDHKGGNKDFNRRRI